MAPKIPALAQSELKSRFIERLGLDERDPAHARLYEMMKDDATAGWDRIQSIEDTLSPGRRENGTLQISETAKHREILRIYRLARPETKALYELGHDTETIEAENWIIRWMLWHIERNRTNRRSSSKAAGHEAKPAKVSPGGPEAAAAAASSSGQSVPSATVVRTITTVVSAASAVPATATAVPDLYPYDPVRDR